MLRSRSPVAVFLVLIVVNCSGQLIIPGFDVNLHAHDGQHVYALPGTPECEAEAERVCSSVVRKCAFGEAECEVQCLSATVPRITEACLRTHPCAADVERLCVDVLPGGIMRCLHSRRLELAPSCASSDSCFSSPNFSEESCGAVRHHKGHHGHQREGSNGRTRFHRGGLLSGLASFGGGGGDGSHASHSLTDGPCACLDECSNHLHDAICDPCDPSEIGSHAQGHDPSHVPSGWFDWLGSSQPHEPHKWPAAAEVHGLQSHPLGGATAAHGPAAVWHPGSGAGAHADGADAHAAAAAAAAAAEAPVSSVHAHGVPVRQQQHQQHNAAGSRTTGHGGTHDLAVGEHVSADPSRHEASHAAALAEAQAAAHAAAQAEAEALAAEAAASRAEAEAAAHAEAAHLAHEADLARAGLHDPSDPGDPTVPHPAEYEPWQHGTEVGADDDDALAGFGAEDPGSSGPGGGVAGDGFYPHEGGTGAPDHDPAAAGFVAGDPGADGVHALSRRDDDDDGGMKHGAAAGGEGFALLQTAERVSEPAFSAGHRPQGSSAGHGNGHGKLGRDGHGQRWTAAASGSGSSGTHGRHAGQGRKPHACVRNPSCGLKRNWCRVSPQCRAPFVHIADVRGCHGPYHGHRHKGCEGAIMGRLHDEENHPAPDLPGHIHEAVDAAHAVHPRAAPHEASIVEARKHAVKAHIKKERHRCHLQEALSSPGEGNLCPKPTSAQWNAASSGPVDEDSMTHIRSCEAPPPFMSFVRHFFDGIASAFKGHAASPGSAGPAAASGSSAASASGDVHGGAASQIHPRFATGYAGNPGPGAAGVVSSVHSAHIGGHPDAAAGGVGSHHAVSAADLAGSGHQDIVSGSSSNVNNKPSYRLPALVADIAHAHAGGASASGSSNGVSMSGSAYGAHLPAAAPHGYAPAVHPPATISIKGAGHRSSGSSGSGSGSSGATSWLTAAAAKALVGEASHELLLIYGIYALIAVTIGSALGICWCIVAARRRQAFGPGSHYAKDASRIRLGAMCQACGRCCALDRLCPSVFGGRPAAGLPLTNAAAAAAAAAVSSSSSAAAKR